MLIVETVTPTGRMRTRRPLAPLDQDRQKLAEEAYALAIFHARRVAAHRRLDFEEAVGVALFGLTLAACRYDPAKGPFGPWAGRIISQKLSGAEKVKARYDSRTARLNVAQGTAYGGDEDDADIQVEDHREQEPGQHAGVQEIIARLKEALDPDTFALLWAAFAEDLPLAQIARARGTSRQWISQLAAQATKDAQKIAPKLCE